MNFKNWLHITESGKGGTTTRMASNMGVTRRSTYLGVGGYFGDPNTQSPIDKAKVALPAAIGTAMQQNFKDQGAEFTPSQTMHSLKSILDSGDKEAFGISLPLQLPMYPETGVLPGLDSLGQYSERVANKVRQYLRSPSTTDTRVRTPQSNPDPNSPESKSKFKLYQGDPNQFDLAVTFTKALARIIIADEVKQQAYNEYDFNKPLDIKDNLQNNILTCTIVFKKKVNLGISNNTGAKNNPPQGKK